jgi:uncharacterized SAM-binding protein YcdF (DUF218 family)
MTVTYRIFGGTIFVLAILWSAGLVGFAAALPRDIADPSSHTDAIVVPTGGHGRLVAGLKLLRAGQAERLFISGVYDGVTVSSLVGENAGAATTCCVDLGYSARDTSENASESAVWMAARSYRSLRLVTGNYHMPRAILEFRSAMPDVKLVANPVFPQHVRVENWWRYRGTAGLIASEYAKYLLALIRTPFSRADSPGSPP